MDDFLGYNFGQQKTTHACAPRVTYSHLGVSLFSLFHVGPYPNTTWFGAGIFRGPFFGTPMVSFMASALKRNPKLSKRVQKRSKNTGINEQKPHDPHVPSGNFGWVRDFHSQFRPVSSGMGLAQPNYSFHGSYPPQTCINPSVKAVGL